jgi:hypothetical protein
MSEHVQGAERALADAQHNPVLSSEQSFQAAQIHALLAIEARLAELVASLREPARLSAAR